MSIETFILKKAQAPYGFRLKCPPCIYSRTNRRSKIFTSFKQFSWHVSQHEELTAAERKRLRHYASVYGKMIKLQMVEVPKH